MLAKLLTLILLISITNAKSFRRIKNHFPGSHIHKVFNDVGEPLIITPYLEEGKIDEAVSLSSVTLNAEAPLTSYSGFFTVNKTANSNMFFWYFQAQKDPATAPTLVRLEGGPGTSAMYGIFLQQGPFFIDESENLKDRSTSWHIDHNILYFDNPVGTGFSYTDEDGYSTNQDQVGENLYEALRQFYLLFPSLKPNPLFISGHSYGVKYASSLGIKIHKKNSEVPEDQKMNLKGLAMESGMHNAVIQLQLGEYLYQHGLFDSHQRDTCVQTEQAMVAAVNENNMDRANELLENLQELFYQPNVSIFNYLTTSYPVENYHSFLNSSSTRKALHVGNLEFHADSTVFSKLASDILVPVTAWVQELLDNYSIIFYNGQLDIIAAYPREVEFLKSLDFKDKELYQNANRMIWKVSEVETGFVKQAGNLVEVLVKSASHMVSIEQPQWALDLLLHLTYPDQHKWDN